MDSVDGHVSNCQELMQHCKQEAKHLLEANVTNRKIHWTHPAFTSFCTSVDDILSYEVHKKFRTLNVTSKQMLTSSGRVLQELSKVYPVALSMFNMCYSTSNSQNEKNTRSATKPDYAVLQSEGRSEYKILWIRTAILEKTLKPIVDEILRNPQRYYTKKSIICHSVFSELFSFLLDGPCSLNFSRMRSIDTSLISPAPSEIISRYSRVFPITSLGYASYQQDSLTSEVWGHIQSLYQTSVTTCLYGKNNIMMTPPNYSNTLDGYLTLIQYESSLLLKWLPNALINRKYEDSNPERFHILSVDITNDVAHIHCHQATKSEVIMIGYNGIAFPALSFLQPSSLIHFLESLENGLHPRGCLEPPLWFLRQSRQQQRHSPEKNGQTTPTRNEDGYPKIWNQVFRVRFGKQRPHDNGDAAQDISEWGEVSSDIEGESPEGRLNGERVTSSMRRSRSKSPSISRIISTVPFMKKGHHRSSNELEKLQTKVSHQLVARYFYSWLSHCRHISRIRTSLSHLVLKPLPSILHEFESDSIDNKLLNVTDWAEFLSLRSEEAWSKVICSIYEGGVSPNLRPQVWPYLLKVYSYKATDSEISKITEERRKDYHDTLTTWKELERTHYMNDDPTSTSFNIRMGVANSSEMSVTNVSQQSTQKHVSTTHHVINTNEGGMPDLIELDSNSEGEDEELKVESSVPMGVASDEGEVDSGCEDRPHTNLSNSEGGRLLEHQTMINKEFGTNSSKLTSHEEKFLEELLKIDKDVPRCDRDYRYFQEPANLTKLRNIISSYIWLNVDSGYSQGMCDLLAPLLVTFDNEEMSFVCFQKLMETMDSCFPPKPGVQDRMNNLRSLLQILESDFFQYLSELPMGDSLFYSYRWFLVNFKREFSYDDIFVLWETSWAARWCSTESFEVFIGFAIIQQYKSAIMDAQLDASEILNLFTDLSDKKAISCKKTISYAQSVASHISQDSCN